MARLREFYKNTVVPELVKQFGYKSVMEVPRIEKITLNMGVGEAVADKKSHGACCFRFRENCWPKTGCYGCS